LKERRWKIMRRFLRVGFPAIVVTLLVIFPLMGSDPMAGGLGRGFVDPSARVADQWQCPGITASGQQIPTTQSVEEKARELAQQYAEQNLKGFTVEKVVPFTGMHMAMYSVELKGPQGETRGLHVHPWGNVMPLDGH